MSTPLIGLQQMSELCKIEEDWLFDRVLTKLSAQMHVILVAERALGLNEYVDELGFQLTEKKPDIHVCRIDLEQAQDSDSFLKLFEATLSDRFPEVTQGLRRDDHRMDVLKLPAMISQRKKIKVAVFLANIHLFARYKDKGSFLKLLKLRLRHQKNCIFCLYGIDNQYLRDLIQYPGPLSGLGHLIQLRQNPTNDRSASIRKLFHIHDKHIGYTTSVQMSYLVDNHSFYLKLLVWHALLRTKHTCTPEILEHAFEDLLYHFDYHFRKIEESLTAKQVRFLQAVLEGNQKLFSKSVREEHQLGATSSVARMKKSLEKKEIVHIGIWDTSFRDPLFREWFRRRYGADG